MSLRSLKSRLVRPRSPDETLHAIKLRAIDAAFQRRSTSSFADLGGVWAVDGGYTFYALEKYSPTRAVLIDEQLTPKVLEKAQRFPALTLVSKNFGRQEVVEELGHVDALLLFDVLLHQVDPSWDEILRLYASATDCFVVVNPQYIQDDRTVRLVDLGRERYLELVPHQPGFEDLFDRLDEFLPDRGRRYRDIHNIWQWGIVDRDLEQAMTESGFELIHFENGGQWRAQPAFENHAFVFSRVTAGGR